MKPKTLTFLALLALGGCTTLQEHPYATGFAVALVAGSIAVSTQHANRVGPAHPMSQIGTPNCAGGECR